MMTHILSIMDKDRNCTKQNGTCGRFMSMSCFRETFSCFFFSEAGRFFDVHACRSIIAHFFSLSRSFPICQSTSYPKFQRNATDGHGPWNMKRVSKRPRTMYTPLPILSVSLFDDENGLACGVVSLRTRRERKRKEFIRTKIL